MQKLIVSKQGKNVLTSTDPNDFIFHSDYNSFQILDSGTLTSQTVDADPKTFTYTHNLGYIPAAFAFAKYPDGYTAMPQSGHKSSTLFYQRRFYLQMTTTQLLFIFYKGASANYNVDIRWYIFDSGVNV